MPAGFAALQPEGEAISPLFSDPREWHGRCFVDCVQQSAAERARKPLEILLVEDNPADVRLTSEAFKDTNVPHRLHAVRDGVEALDFLRRAGAFADMSRPDVVLLDLNLPRKDGREVLAEMKGDADLRRIPVVVLTTSQAERDLLQAYDLHANCYLIKPIEFERFIAVIGHIRDFWLSAVSLPPR